MHGDSPDLVVEGKKKRMKERNIAEIKKERNILKDTRGNLSQIVVV